MSKVGYDAVKTHEPVPLNNIPCPNKCEFIDKLIKELEEKDKKKNEKE